MATGLSNAAIFSSNNLEIRPIAGRIYITTPLTGMSLASRLSHLVERISLRERAREGASEGSANRLLNSGV